MVTDSLLKILQKVIINAAADAAASTKDFKNVQDKEKLYSKSLKKVLSDFKDGLVVSLDLSKYRWKVPGAEKRNKISKISKVEVFLFRSTKGTYRTSGGIGPDPSEKVGAQIKAEEEQVKKDYLEKIERYNKLFMKSRERNLLPHEVDFIKSVQSLKDPFYLKKKNKEIVYKVYSNPEYEKEILFKKLICDVDIGPDAFIITNERIALDRQKLGDLVSELKKLIHHEVRHSVQLQTYADLINTRYKSVKADIFTFFKPDPENSREEVSVEDRIEKLPFTEGENFGFQDLFADQSLFIFPYSGIDKVISKKFENYFLSPIEIEAFLIGFEKTGEQKKKVDLNALRKKIGKAKDDAERQYLVKQYEETKNKHISYFIYEKYGEFIEAQIDQAYMYFLLACQEIGKANKKQNFLKFHGTKLTYKDICNNVTQIFNSIVDVFSKFLKMGIEYNAKRKNLPVEDLFSPIEEVSNNFFNSKRQLFQEKAQKMYEKFGEHESVSKSPGKRKLEIDW